MYKVSECFNGGDCPEWQPTSAVVAKKPLAGYPGGSVLSRETDVLKAPPFAPPALTLDLPTWLTEADSVVLLLRTASGFLAGMRWGATFCPPGCWPGCLSPFPRGSTGTCARKRWPSCPRTPWDRPTFVVPYHRLCAPAALFRYGRFSNASRQSGCRYPVTGDHWLPR